MKEEYSATFLRQRKMMLVLPLLVIPFLTMAFWGLGGGKGTGEGKAKKSNGLNLNLPDANLKDNRNEDKLSFYNEALDDSVKKQRLLLNDPFYKDSINALQEAASSKSFNPADAGGSYNELSYSPYSNHADPNEQRVYKKIKELQQQINQPQVDPHISNSIRPDLTYTATEVTSDEVNKLSEMMVQMNDNLTEDPEMHELNNTLDKILDIQNPQRVLERIRQKSVEHKDAVFVVNKTSRESNIGLLDTSINRAVKASAFFSIDDLAHEENDDNAIQAVVNTDQILVNGSVVKLRLATEVYVNGVLIQKNNLVSGVASLSDERLKVDITSIRNNNSIFPVKLEIYDMDGLPGIYIPGAISRDVAKQSADNGLQVMELSSLDPSLKAQAAAAGISTVKNLLGKKVKQIKVMVKAGYKVLLKNKNIGE